MSQSYVRYFIITITSLSMAYTNEIVTEGSPDDEILNYTMVTSFTTYQTEEEITTFPDYNEATTTEEPILLPPVFDVTEYVNNCHPGGLDFYLSCENEPILWTNYGESIQKMSEKFCYRFQTVINIMMIYSCRPSRSYAQDALISSKWYMENYNVEFPENITKPQIEKRKEEYIESFDTIRKLEQALNLSEELKEGYIKMFYQTRIVNFLEYKEKESSNKGDVHIQIEQEVNLLKKYKESFGTLGKNLTKYLKKNNLENVFNSGNIALILNTSLHFNNKIQEYPIEPFTIVDTKMRIQIQQKFRMLKIEEAIMLLPVFNVTQYENDCLQGGIISFFPCEEAILWEKYGENLQQVSEKFCHEFQGAIKKMMHYSCRPSRSYAEDALISSKTYMENQNVKFPENITDPRIAKRKEEYIKSFETIRDMEKALNLSEELRDGYTKMVYQASMAHFLLEYKEKHSSNNSDINLEIEQEVNLSKKYKESFAAIGKNLIQYLKQNHIENVFNSGKLALILNSSLYINNTNQQYPIQQFLKTDNKMRNLIQQKIKMLNNEKTIKLLPLFNVTQYEQNCPPGYWYPFPCDEEATLWEEYGESLQETSKKICAEFQEIIQEMMYYSCRPSPSFAEDGLRWSKRYMENYNMKFPEEITNPQLKKRKEDYIKSFQTILKMEQALNLSDELREGYIKMVYQGRMVYFLNEYKEKQVSNDSDIYPEIEKEVNLLKKYKESLAALGKHLTKYLKQNNLENVFNFGKLASILQTSLNNEIDEYPFQQFIVKDNKMRNWIRQKIEMLNIEENMLISVFDITQYENNCSAESVVSRFPCKGESILWEEYGKSLQEMLEKRCDHFQDVISQMMDYSCRPSLQTAENALKIAFTDSEDSNIYFPEYIKEPHLREHKEDYIKSFDTIFRMRKALNTSGELRKLCKRIAYQGRVVDFLKEYNEKQASDNSDIYLQEVNWLMEFEDDFAERGKYFRKHLDLNDLQNIFKSGKIALILKDSLHYTTYTHASCTRENIDDQYIVFAHQKLQKLTLYISPILVVILLAVGLTGNILLLAIFIKFKEMRTVANLMIMNLTIIDCISLLLNLPTQYFWVASSWHDEWGCSTFQFSRKFAVTVSTYSIVMISLQRYLAVKIFPKTGRCTIGKRTKTALQFISVWIFGFLYNIPRLSDSSIENGTCIDANLRILPIIVTADFLFICILPSVSIVLLSVFTASNIKTSVSNVPGETTGQQELKKGRMLSVHVLTGLAVLFVISYFPYYVFQFITVMCGFYPDLYTFATIHTCTYCLLFTNSCLNPIALGIMSKKYRKYYIELIGYFKCISLNILEGQSTSTASVATTETYTGYFISKE